MTRFNIQALLQTPSLYPVTACYLSAVTVIMLVTQGWLSGEFGVLVLGIVSVLIVLVQMQRDLNTVHHLVNSYTDKLDDRITQLTDTLTDAGVQVPDEPTRRTSHD